MSEIPPKTPYGRIWLAFFLYTCVAACGVQFFMLPVLLPQLHDGNGLFNFGDFQGHHRLAVELAQAIHAQGWGAWVLRPEGQGNAGIAGAIYALTAPKPWTLIPLNAALHATAALALLWLVQLFLPGWRQAIWCALPFLLYPSAALWYAQNLKDGYSIAGFMLFLCGWIAWMRWQTWQGKRWISVWPLGCMALGVMLVWIVRPYMLQMMQGVAALLAVGGTVAFFRLGRQERLRWPQSFIGAGLLWVIVGTLTSPELLEEGVLSEGRFFQISAPEPSQVVNAGELVWNASGFLPEPVEGALYGLARLRQRFIDLYPTADSKIDVDVSFHSTTDVLIYAPKAALIALLYPVPTQWLAPGSGDTSWTRPFVALEMVGLYVWLVFLPAFLRRYRRRSEAWMILSFCLGMMVIYALAIPNLGSLYRVRYSFIMAIAALGVAGLIQTVKAHRKPLAKGASPP